MSDQYLGEIRMMGCNFPPQGWLTCNGSLLQISEFDALFSLLGTTYGGDGVNTFGIPDLRSRVPVCVGRGAGLSPYVLGQNSGQENVVLNTNTMPVHTHPFMAITTPASGANPTNALPAATGSNFYSDQTPSASLSPNSMSSVGSTQSHSNVQPVQAQNFVIATEGLYPSST